MWRSAFVGLLVACVVVVGWRSAEGAPTDAAQIDSLRQEVLDSYRRIGELETQVDALSTAVPPAAPASVYAQGGFVNIAAPYQWVQYCRIDGSGPSYLAEYELTCERIIPYK